MLLCCGSAAINQSRFRTSDADAENEAPPSNRPKTSTPAEHQQDFSTHRRIIARFVGPYVIIEDVIMHGLNVDTTLDYDEENEEYVPFLCSFI
jgi:hypothetical protein